MNTELDTRTMPVGEGPQTTADPYMPLSDERLAAIDALLQAATPGPWKANEPVGIVTDAAGQPLAVFGGCAQDQADAAFVAVAPEAVGELLAEVAFQQKWSEIGWRNARVHAERCEATDEKLADQRVLVTRLRAELSRQARQRDAVIEDLRRELTAARTAGLAEAITVIEQFAAGSLERDTLRAVATELRACIAKAGAIVPDACKVCGDGPDDWCVGCAKCRCEPLHDSGCMYAETVR